MSIEEKNKNEILSEIAADLFAKSKGKEQLPSNIERLRTQIKKVIDNEETLFGKFRALVESFHQLIPNEQQRYNAAIQALSTTAKVSTQDIVAAVRNQLKELAILEKGFLGSSFDWRNDLKVMQAKSLEMKNEIARLRENIVRLEREEKELLHNTATREKEMELVETAVKKLFADIAAEVTAIDKKVEESTTSLSRTVVDRNAIESSFFGNEKKNDLEKEVPGPSSPKCMESDKVCPLCGGRMNFHLSEQKWICYSCANEEAKQEEAAQTETAGAVKASPAQNSDEEKGCPMCGGHMNFHLKEKIWMCYSCAYQEGGVNGEKKNEQVSPSDFEFPEDRETSKLSRSREALPTTKNCPACRKKMIWYPEKNAWECSSCGYERRSVYGLP